MKSLRRLESPSPVEHQTVGRCSQEEDYYCSVQEILGYLECLYPRQDRDPASAVQQHPQTYHLHWDLCHPWIHCEVVHVLQDHARQVLDWHHFQWTPAERPDRDL
jgi:hypothetical protein